MARETRQEIAETVQEASVKALRQFAQHVLELYECTDQDDYEDGDDVLSGADFVDAFGNAVELLSRRPERYIVRYESANGNAYYVGPFGVEVDAHAWAAKTLDEEAGPWTVETCSAPWSAKD